jgi:hypothetical protein
MKLLERQPNLGGRPPFVAGVPSYPGLGSFVCVTQVRRMACWDTSRALLARSVDDALLRVERQRERIGEMVQTGQPTQAAEELLSIFLRLFADMVELEHRINAMLQEHHNLASEFSTFQDVQDAINSAQLRLKHQLSTGTGSLIQTEALELRWGIENRKKRALNRSNTVRIAKCSPRRRRVS